jgi:hypothetical protein
LDFACGNSESASLVKKIDPSVYVFAGVNVPLLTLAPPQTLKWKHFDID